MSEALEQGYFTRLKELQGPESTQSIQSYISVALCLCQNLENFVLSNRGSDYFETGRDTEAYDLLSSKLNLFTRLKRLDIRKQTNKSIIQFDKVFDTFPCGNN